jgi:hypothetical protein
MPKHNTIPCGLTTSRARMRTLELSPCEQPTTAAHTNSATTKFAARLARNRPALQLSECHLELLFPFVQCLRASTRNTRENRGQTARTIPTGFTRLECGVPIPSAVIGCPAAIS